MCVFTSSCSCTEGAVDGSKDLDKDECREKATEWAALGKTLLLEEGVVSALRCFVPNGVVVVVKVVKKGEEGGEVWVLCKLVSCGVSGDRVEHVLDVEEEESACGVCVMGQVFFNLEQCCVDRKVNTALEVDAELSEGDK